MEEFGSKIEYIATDQHLTNKNYDLVLIEMESFSSTVESAKEIRQRLGEKTKIAVVVKESIPAKIIAAWNKAGVNCVVKMPISKEELSKLLEGDDYC